MKTTSSEKVNDGERRPRRRHARALGLRRWLARARGLGQGLTVPELVSELHVRRGLPLAEVAQVLGLSLETVRKHRPRKGAARAVRAAQSEADFTGLREHIGVLLWQTVTASFHEVILGAENGQGGPPAPPLLSVRMRALNQLAKLYDVGPKRRRGGVDGG